MPLYRVTVDPDWVEAWKRRERYRAEKKPGYEPRPVPNTRGLPETYNACDPDHAVRLCRMDGQVDAGPSGLIAELEEPDDAGNDAASTGEPNQGITG